MTRGVAGQLHTIRTIRAPLVLALGMASMVMVAQAEQTVEVSGTNTWEPVPAEATVSQGAPKDAPVFASSLKGKSKETSKSGLFDGATLYDTGVGEVLGNRLVISSVSRGERGGDTYYFRNEGICDIFNAGARNESTRCSGTWRLIPGGTGRYAGLRGSGTWRSGIGADGGEISQWDGVVTR